MHTIKHEYICDLCKRQVQEASQLEDKHCQACYPIYKGFNPATLQVDHRFMPTRELTLRECALWFNDAYWGQLAADLIESFAAATLTSEEIEDILKYMVNQTFPLTNPTLLDLASNALQERKDNTIKAAAGILSAARRALHFHWTLTARLKQYDSTKTKDSVSYLHDEYEEAVLQIIAKLKEQANSRTIGQHVANSRKLGAPPQSALRTLRRLEKKGLVERVSDAHGPRRHPQRRRWQLTIAGSQQLNSKALNTVLVARNDQGMV